MKMRKNEMLLYKGAKYSRLEKNENFSYVLLRCIAYKYNITYTVNNLEIPKEGKTKEYIIKRCKEDFSISISKKQINALLHQGRGKFPYKSIIIIELIYNLLKEKQGRSGWQAELIRYIEKSLQDNEKYERFLLKDIPEQISRRVDEFMESEYSDLFRCFIDSREAFYRKFSNISMEEHCKENFPSKFFDMGDIPKSVYNRQLEERVYMRWNI